MGIYDNKLKRSRNHRIEKTRSIIGQTQAKTKEQTRICKVCKRNLVTPVSKSDKRQFPAYIRPCNPDVPEN